MRMRLGLLALVAAAVAAVPAFAADQSATLNAGKATFTWEGHSGDSVSDPGIGLPVPACYDDTMAHECEDILINLEAAGDLHVKLDSPDAVGAEDPSGDPTGFCGGPCVGASVEDYDAYFFKSNAAGEPLGDSLGEADPCSSTTPSEECDFKALEAGYYLLRVEYFQTTEFQAPYTGTVTLSNFAAAEPTVTAESTPTPAPPAEPAPAAQPQEQAPPPPPVNGDPAPTPTPTPTANAGTGASSKKAALKRCRAKARKKKNVKKRKAALKRCARRYR